MDQPPGKNMYRRNLQPVVRDLLAEFRIVYLTGPRQAGKTTLARSVAGELDMGYVTLDDQATLYPSKVIPMDLSAHSAQNVLCWTSSSMHLT